MEFIKKIIREELERVLSVLNEADFYQTFDYKKISTPDSNKGGKNSIIYDYEKGKIFAGDNLASDISNLNRYQLVEYLPKSTNDEMWSFEFYTVYGTVLIVDIRRIMIGQKSFWSMKFGQLYKGEQIPSLLDEIENVEGYDNFVNTANKIIAKKLDPSNY